MKKEPLHVSGVKKEISGKRTWTGQIRPGLAGPEGLYLLMEKIMAENPESYPFAENYRDTLAFIRRVCPDGAGVYTGKSSPDRDDIYRVMGMMTGFERDQLQSIRNLEDRLAEHFTIPAADAEIKMEECYKRTVSVDPSLKLDLAWQLLAGMDADRLICLKRKGAEPAAGRAEDAEECPDREKAFRMGLTLCGPILYDYVKWLLNICINNGIRRLYFISRDGYVLKKIADIIIESREMDIQTHYLYASRRVMRTEIPEEQDLLRQYIRQEMDLSDERYALVDIQGTGVSIERLSEVVGKAFRSFYFFLLNMPDPVKNQAYVYSTIPEGLIETFCRAPHGLVTGYRKGAEGRLEPVFFTGPAEEAQYDMLRTYTEGVCAFAEYFTDMEDLLGINIEMRRVSQALYDCICHYPASEDADFAGEIIHDRYNRGDTPYAPVLTPQELEEVKRDPLTYRGGNLAYSILRTELNAEGNNK